MADDVTVELILKAVKELHEKLEELLNYGRKSVQDSLEEFVNGGVGKMFGMASAYQKCLTSLNLKTKAELERLINRHARNPELRDASHELLDVEQEWDHFFKAIDKDMKGGNGESVQVGMTGPIDIPLVDARTSEKTSLKQYLTGTNNLSEISAKGGKVIIISFGLQDGAKLWLTDTGAPFPMLLDMDRKVYHFFGLYRSVWKVWGVGSLVYYGEAMTAGIPIPKPYANIHDDTIQMGGDFILNSEGHVSFLYPSKTNQDRPSVDLLIDELQKLQ